MDGLVYINHGRIIVDCPTGCGNAFIVDPQEKTKKCQAGAGQGCGAVINLLFPSMISELMNELQHRPSKATRNWFPLGHPIAEKLGAPQDQSPTELAQEFERMSN